MNGILVLNKPQKFTSFDVVAKLRHILNIKKIGHAGTLDPMATGVLPILMGMATKAQDLFINTNKEYLATFKLGITTDTQDITGNIIKKSSFCVLEKQLKDTLNLFKGEIFQVPPMYSAVKYKGKRLYSLARQGLTVERKERPVTIYDIKLCKFDAINGICKIRVTCSKGTYIRTICSDIGDTLGCGATLTELIRTSACGFDIFDSISLNDVEVFKNENKLQNYIKSIDSIFSSYKNVIVTKNQSIRFKNGGALSLNRINITEDVCNKQKICVYDLENNFLGLGEVCTAKNELLIFKLFNI